MRKLRPDSNQADLGADACERLLEACRSMGYAAAADWAREHLGIATSVASLCRWWQRQATDQLRGRMRQAVRASEEFDAELDGRDLDARAQMALRAAYWDAVQSADLDAIERLGKLVLAYSGDARAAERQERLLAAERERDSARSALSAAQARIAELEAALSAAGRNSAADPAAVMAEVDRILGRKSQP